MNLMAWLMIVLTNTTVVIDINGKVRELLPGETPSPGEVIVVVGRGATAVFEVEIEINESKGGMRSIEIDGDIASVYDMLDSGEDPTSNSDYATSSGDGSKSHVDELQDQGLTELQSESLIDFLYKQTEEYDNSIKNK